MRRAATNPAWINASIFVGASFFLFALIVSAVFDPKIRLLHALQAFIYVAVIVLAGKNFAAIIVTTGPQYTELLKRALWL